MPALTSIMRPAIPLPAKVFGWILVLAGTFFAYVYTLNPGLSFPGVSISSYSEQFGLYSTGVRILAAVLGIVVALIMNSAALFALMLVTRIFTELGDVIVGLIINGGSPNMNTYSLVVLALVEGIVLFGLVRVLLRAVGRVRP